MPDPQIVRMVDPHGGTHDVPADQVEDALIGGFHVETGQESAQRVADVAKDDRYGGTLDKVNSVIAGINRTASLGLSDVAANVTGDREYLQGISEVNPGLSTVGEIAGGFVSPVGRVGGAIEAGIGATSAIGRIGAAAAGYGAEGVLFGAGSGVSELALDDKPITVERIGSVLSSHMLYGGGIGAATGTLGKLAEMGLSKARTSLAAREAREVTDDLATMDAKQLRKAREAELDAIKADHKLEIEAVEGVRVTERKTIADDIASLRKEIKDSNQWATTKGIKLEAAEGKLSAAELGRISMKAEKQLAGALDNPIGLAKNPTKALDALQRQENALVKLIEHGDDLRAAYATDALGGKRAMALEAAPKLLEKNRALQARIAKVNEALPSAPASSTRLEAIEAARDALSAGGKANPLASVPQRMLEGTAFGTVASAVGGLAIPGAGMAAPLVGAAVSKMLGEKVFGRLSGAASGQAARASKTAQVFLGQAERVTKSAVPIATRVLSSVRYGGGPDRDEQPRRGAELAHHYAARADEVRSLVQPGPDGKAMMREEARAKVAEHLAPIGTQFPMLADALEEIAARRVQFLADRLPRKPDVFAYTLGPDRWQPSDMEMRKWARYVAGVEDPGSILDRVVDGAVSPEDAEVMREVYPEMLADLQQQILEQSSQAKKTIPYQRRLALSMLTGMPVDPSCDPQILAVLQASYANEQGSEGGSMAPRAQPAFGSVSRSLPEPTPAQKRSA